MTMFPRELTQRFAQEIASVRSRVRKLESRTAGIDSGFPLMALPAVIDPGYASGDPMAYLNGSATLTGPYQYVASYTPAAGDSVIALPVVATRTYIILGRLA
jgi:hypothetical protein